MLKELNIVRMQIGNTILAKSEVRSLLLLFPFLDFGCCFFNWLPNALKYSRPQADLKRDLGQSFNEKTSVKVEQTPDQFATAVLPPVPANSFQLESDFRQLRSSPDMLYQYLKVSGGSQQRPWVQVRDFLLVAVAMLCLPFV